MKLASALALLFVLALNGQNARAGGPTPLVRVGDAVSGLGTVSSLASRVAVDDAGSWWVLATSGSTSAIVSNGQVVLRTGDLLPSPAGATVAAIRSFGVNRQGTTVWTVDLSGGGQGIYRGGALVMRTGTAVLTGGSWPSGSTYGLLRHAQPNGNAQILLLGEVNTVSTGALDFVSVVNVNGAGQGTSESVRVRENSPILISQIIDSVPVRPEQASLRDSGVTTFTFGTLNRSWLASTSSSCSFGSSCTFLLDAGTPGPTGETLGDLDGAALGTNAVGNWVSKIRAGTPSTVRICGNYGAFGFASQLYAEGSVVAGIAPHVVESILFDGPIFVSDDNRVAWYANWSDPVTTRDEGLLVNQELVVQEGVTATAGGTLESLDPYGFAMSDNGRYLVFRGRLAGGIEGAFRLDLSPATIYCFGDGTATPCPCGGVGSAGAGCPHSANAGGALLRLGVGDIPCVSQDTVTLQVSQAPAATPALFFQGTIRQNGGAGVVFGDGLRCTGGTIIRLATKNTSGGSATYPTSGEPAVSVRGQVPSTGGTRTYQAWYRNAATFCTASTFNLTNGLEIVWQP